MRHKRFVMWAALGLTALTILPVSLAQARAPWQQPEQQNLLLNPGFEGYNRSQDNAEPNAVNWTRDTFNNISYREIYTPQGWITFWREGGEGEDVFGRPECKLVPNAPPFDGTDGNPKRIHRGYYAALCFTFYRKQDAGFYQVVRQLPPGATVEAAVHAHAWSCDNDEHGAFSCNDPTNFQFQIGIDPNGGTDPWSSNILWSKAAYPRDAYGLVGPVSATVGPQGVVSVFLRAQSRWPFKHNDAYWDDASLVITSPLPTPTATVPPLPPTPEAQPTPAAPTPPPAGAVTHTVVEGDTLFGLALQYGVDVAQLRQLNAERLGPGDLLTVGQIVVISVPVPEPTPTATPPAAGTAVSATAGAPLTAAGTAALCVLAYQDRNGDTLRQPDSDSLLPNAQYTLIAEGGTSQTYTTNGLSEPYCFQNLPPGRYTLRQTPPTGYRPTGPTEWLMQLADGQVYTQETGYAREQESTAEPGALTPAPATPAPTPTSGWIASLPTGLLVGGAVVAGLALVGVAGYLFWLLRRRR